VLDALEMAMWARGRQGIRDLSGLVHHSDAGQYTSPDSSFAPSPQR
jgi:putative transposase